jgi:hypothetical protein
MLRTVDFILRAKLLLHYLKPSGLRENPFKLSLGFEMPIFVSPDRFLAVVKTLGMFDLRITVNDIALEARLPYTILHLILTESLVLQKIGNTWVPKLFAAKN